MATPFLRGNTHRTLFAVATYLHHPWGIQYIALVLLPFDLHIRGV